MNDNRTWEPRVYLCDGSMPSPCLALVSCTIDGVEHFIHESSRPGAFMALVSATDTAREWNLLRIGPASRGGLFTAAALPPGRFMTVAEIYAEPRRPPPGFSP